MMIFHPSNYYCFILLNPYRASKKMFSTKVSVSPHFHGVPPTSAFDAMRLESHLVTGVENPDSASSRILSMIDFIWSLLLGCFDCGINYQGFSLSSKGVSRVKGLLRHFLDRFDPSLYCVRLPVVIQHYNLGKDLVGFSYTSGIHSLIVKEIKSLSVSEKKRYAVEEFKEECSVVDSESNEVGRKTWEFHFMMFLVSPLILLSVSSAVLPDYDFSECDFRKAKTKNLLDEIIPKTSRLYFRTMLCSSLCSFSNLELFDKFENYRKQHPSPRFEPVDDDEMMFRVFPNRV